MMALIELYLKLPGIVEVVRVEGNTIFSGIDAFVTERSFVKRTY
jgi:hypothetical protein